MSGGCERYHFIPDQVISRVHPRAGSARARRAGQGRASTGTAPAETGEARKVCIVADELTAMLEGKRDVPCVADQVPDGAGLLQELSEKRPVSRTRRYDDCIRRIPEGNDPFPRQLRRRGRNKDARMREDSECSAECQVTDAKWFRAATKALEVVVDGAMARCVLSHRADQYVHVEQHHGSAPVHQVIERARVSEVHTWSQPLSAIGGERF